MKHRKSRPLAECSIDGCTRVDIAAKGMCKLHYYRYKRNGDPNMVLRHSPPSPPSVRQLHPREYKSWMSMKTRCYNKNYPQYKDYGGRKIFVCNRWLGKNGFVNFLADMGERPEGTSLDRIDNDSWYCPSNCRWATRGEQANNTRKTRWIVHDGEKRTISEWARKKGIPPEVIYNRIMLYKWTNEKALETPWIRKERRKK